MNTIIKIFLCAIFALTLTLSASAAERVESAILYVVSQDGNLIYNGWREASFAQDVAFDDQTGSGVVDVASLTSVLGVAPDFDQAALGDVVGEALGDVFYADLTLEDDAISAVRLVKRVVRPNIGVPWTGGDKPASIQRLIGSEFVRFGARVTMMGQVTDDASCEAIMAPLDGMFMPGGEDVNPKLYGETPYKHGSVDCNDVRDVSDSLVCRWAIKNNLPSIWVCRGIQILNVSLGGALIQDVPTHIGKKTLSGEIPYDQVKPLDDDCTPAHFRAEAFGVKHWGGGYHRLGSGDKGGIVPGSLLYEIVGRRTTLPSVYTSHHQAADPTRIGEGLTITATAEDGIVEALEYQANDFALAMQTHVEHDVFPSDPNDPKRVAQAEFSALFFKALVERARQHAKVL